MLWDIKTHFSNLICQILRQINDCLCKKGKCLYFLQLQQVTHAQLAELQKDLLKKANAKQGYEDLAEEIETLRSEKEGLLLEDANRIGLQKRLDELETFLDEHQEPVTDYDEGLVRRLVDRITVYDDCLAFEFKSGLETEVQM